MNLNTDKPREIDFLDKAVEIIIEKSWSCPYVCVIEARDFIEREESNFEGFREKVKDIFKKFEDDIEDAEFYLEFKEMPSYSSSLKNMAKDAKTRMVSEYKNFLALNVVLNIPRLDEDLAGSIDSECAATLGRFYGYMALQTECLKSVSIG